MKHNKPSFDDAPASGERRLAAVIVLDLVKHSARPRAEAQKIRESVEGVFFSATEKLNLQKNVSWKHTGDGYFCTLTGSSAERLLDFLTISIPNLLRVLKPYDQGIRVGVDFGIIQLLPNALTLQPEHFDVPGIRATRLESQAAPNEVLCGENVYNIFTPLYPGSFSPTPKIVNAKDRQLSAYIFQVPDFAPLRALVSTFFERCEGSPAKSPKMKILVVDDEPLVCEAVRMMLGFDGHEVKSAQSATEGLALFEQNEFDMIFTDLFMPPLNGDFFALQLKARAPRVPVIMLTAHSEQLRNTPPTGIDVLISKPFLLEDLRRAIAWVQAVRSSEAVWQFNAALRAHNPAILLSSAGEVFHRLLRSMRSIEDPAHVMIRHKAKNLVAQYVVSLQPGVDLLDATVRVFNQLRTLSRLSEHIYSNEKKLLSESLRFVVKDLKKEHRGVTVTSHVTKTAKQTCQPSNFVTLISLIACELIDNAVEALGSRGTVEISADVLSSKNCFYMSVRDSGSGVRKGDEFRIFEENYSTRGTGRGLGLSLIKAAVDMLGGRIKYEFDKLLRRHLNQLHIVLRQRHFARFV